MASRQRLDLPDEVDTGDLLAREAKAAAEHAMARLAAIEISTSWRITAPLRAAVTAIRRLAGRT